MSVPRGRGGVGRAGGPSGVRRRRPGFVLLTVLGVIVGLAVLALGVSLAGRAALGTARNRAALAAAEWHAEGCVERARAAVYEAMTTAPPDGVAAAWDSLDRVVLSSPVVRSAGCLVTARAAGDGLDVNTATAEQLGRLFRTLGIGPPRADSLTAALLDWRDADTVPRPLGAERAWYAARHRPGPRDSALADARELRLVRGFEHMGDTLALFTTDRARMPLSHVPLAVLSSLPGVTPSALAHAAELRRLGRRVPELAALGAGLPRDDYAMLLAHFGELARRTTPDPEGWLVAAEAAAGDPAVRATVELRLVRAGRRAAILGRR